mmetsp:Transcript_16258/g.39004  ORF Transcript_16258/g.39004 Transcript_16258/m.39004 type:complete len:205 (+) Transcript_16258:431-1045(+)
MRSTSTRWRGIRLLPPCTTTPRRRGRMRASLWRTGCAARWKLRMLRPRRRGGYGTCCRTARRASSSSRKSCSSTAASWRRSPAPSASRADGIARSTASRRPHRYGNLFPWVCAKGLLSLLTTPQWLAGVLTRPAARWRKSTSKHSRSDCGARGALCDRCRIELDGATQGGAAQRTTSLVRLGVCYCLMIPLWTSVSHVCSCRVP